MLQARLVLEERLQLLRRLTPLRRAQILSRKKKRKDVLRIRSTQLSTQLRKGKPKAVLFPQSKSTQKLPQMQLKGHRVHIPNWQLSTAVLSTGFWL